jgi:hypothetical protein
MLTVSLTDSVSQEFDGLQNNGNRSFGLCVSRDGNDLVVSLMFGHNPVLVAQPDITTFLMKATNLS